jgi:hypothetical protein
MMPALPVAEGSDARRGHIRLRFPDMRRRFERNRCLARESLR